MNIQEVSTSSLPPLGLRCIFHPRWSLIGKVASGVLAVGVGFPIAYGGAVAEWDRPLVVISNVSLIFAYGSLGSWGLYNFLVKAFGPLLSGHEMNSVSKGAGRVTQVLLSMGLGFFAQIPIGEIAKDFQGVYWGIATQLGGFWVQAYSQYALSQLAIKKVFRTSLLHCTRLERMRIKLICRIENSFISLARHARLQSQEERDHCYSNWTRNRLFGNEMVRIQCLFQDMKTLSEDLFQVPKTYSRGLSLLRGGVMIGSPFITAFIFYQNYLLANSFWSEELDITSLIILCNLISILPNLYLVIRGAVSSSADVFDYVGSCCVRVEPTLGSAAFPKITRGLRSLALLIAAFTQIQTAKISEGYFSPSTPFGLSFLISNVTGTALFIYMAMKDLIEEFCAQAIDMGLASRDAEKLKQLLEDIQACIDSLEEKSLEELSDIVGSIPHKETRRRIMESLDPSLTPLLATHET